jgi:hypothetical protein
MSERSLKKEGRGACDYKSGGGVVICDWYDNKVVTVASNFHSVMPTRMQSRWSKKDNVYINIPCPNIITAYNRSMGGVDRCDMMLALYRMKMKSRKWYRRIFFHFVDLALINAWTLLRQSSQPKLKLVDFKLEVAVSLIRGGLVVHPMTRVTYPRARRVDGDVVGDDSGVDNSGVDNGDGDGDDEDEDAGTTKLSFLSSFPLLVIQCNTVPYVFAVL